MSWNYVRYWYDVNRHSNELDFMAQCSELSETEYFDVIPRRVIITLDERQRHAEKAITLWNVAAQLGQNPDLKHLNWWLGYREAILNVRSGEAPWPVEFGLPC